MVWRYATTASTVRATAWRIIANEVAAWTVVSTWDSPDFVRFRDHTLGTKNKGEIKKMPAILNYKVNFL